MAAQEPQSRFYITCSSEPIHGSISGARTLTPRTFLAVDLAQILLLSGLQLQNTKPVVISSFKNWSQDARIIGGQSEDFFSSLLSDYIGLLSYGDHIVST